MDQRHQTHLSSLLQPSATIHPGNNARGEQKRGRRGGKRKENSLGTQDWGTNIAAGCLPTDHPTEEGNPCLPSPDPQSSNRR